MAKKHETSPSMGTNTALMLNLPRNSSVVLLLYIIPSVRNVEKAAVINVWNYPVKYYELRHDNFLQLIFTKEIHVRKSTQGSLCTNFEEHEAAFYKVKQLNFAA